MLINLRATHSFICREFAACMDVAPVPLDYYIEICIVAKESLWPIKVLKGLLFCIEGQVMDVNLIVLDLQRLDVIFNMNWLTTNYSLVEFFLQRGDFQAIRVTNGGVL